ncbi:MAG: PASTA domain-containing protein [Nitrospinales bacterium]
MVEQSKVNSLKQVNSKPFYIRFLSGLAVCFICMAVLSCESTPEKRGLTNGFDEPITPPPPPPVPPELKLAREAKRTAQDALQKANQAQQSVKDVQESPKLAQRYAQEAQQNSELAKQEARQAKQAALDAQHASDRALQFIRQTRQSPHQAQQSAQQAEQAVQLAQQAYLRAQQSVEKAEQSLEQAEQAVEQAERSVKNAEHSARDARDSAQDSRRSVQKARQLAQNASESIDPSKPQSLEVTNLVQESERLVKEAEKIALTNTLSDDQMRHAVEQAREPVNPAEQKTRQARDDVRKAKESTEKSHRSLQIFPEAIEKLYVPNLVGKSLSEAQEKLEKRGLRWQVEMVGKKAVIGTVLKQDPKSGGTKKILTPVELTVYQQVKEDDPERRKVPIVTNLSLNKAIQKLEEHDLSWKVVKIKRSKESNPSTVLRQEPAPQSKKKIFTPVELVMTSSDKYPEQTEIAVPPVEGLSLMKAKKTLRKKDLSWKLKVIDPDRQSGKVVRQSPAPKSLRPADNTVELVVQRK